MPATIASANAAGLLAGALLDLALGDPRRWHPVAGYGRAAGWLERRMYAPDVAAGAAFTAVAVGVPVAAAVGATLVTRHRPLLRAALVAGVTWTVLGPTSLRREANAMAQALAGASAPDGPAGAGVTGGDPAGGDLAGASATGGNPAGGHPAGGNPAGGNPAGGDLSVARELLPHLCGRDPAALDAVGLTRATVESVAENTADAAVGALFWGAVAGLPGLVGYRAVNTLDAMVGHRSARYARFGTAAARLDDAANLAPARITAALTVAAAPLAGGSSWRALRTWLRDGPRHPSPNSGQCEAAMAGALGVRLGGRNVYAGHVSDRPVLGRHGRSPTVTDIHRAVRLSALVTAAAAAAAAIAAGSRSRPTRPTRTTRTTRARRWRRASGE